MRRAETIDYRNAIYCGYVQVENNPLSMMFQGPGILLYDDNTCLISQWKDNQPIRQSMIVIHPNRYITYYHSETLKHTFNPFSNVSLFHSAKNPNLYIVEVQDKLVKVFLNEENQREEISILGENLQIQGKIKTIKKQMEQQLNLNILNSNKTKYFLKKVQTTLDFGQTIFDFCQEPGHQNFINYNRTILFPTSKQKLKLTVIGANFEHPSHFGNGIVMLVKIGSENSFYIHTIKAGKEQTYNVISNTVICVGLQNDRIEKINGEVFMNKQANETMKMKKKYHMKSNNFINKYLIQQKTLPHQFLIIDKVQKDHVQQKINVAQNLLEIGSIYLPAPVSTTDIKKQLLKMQEQKNMKQVSMKKTFALRRPSDLYDTMKKPKNDRLADLYTLKKNTNKKSKGIIEKQLQQKIERYNQYTERKERKCQCTNYLEDLAQTYRQIKDQMRTEAKDKHLPLKFPYNVQECKNIEKVYPSRFKSRFP